MVSIILEYVLHNVKFAGNLGNEALIVTRDDEVFALGSNGAGCLGLGDMHSTLTPKQVKESVEIVKAARNSSFLKRKPYM